MAPNLEAHSITSLALRLKLLVSRATLRDWIKTGKLLPEGIQAKQSRYLIFSTKKLNQILGLLEQGYEERVGRLAKNSAEAVRFRSHADQMALHKIRHNQARAKRGQKPLPESSPALDDNDCRGATSLTHDLRKDKDFITVFGGFGAWKTNTPKKGTATK